MTVTVFLHLYYDTSWPSLKSRLTALPEGWQFFINISNDDFSRAVLSDIRSALSPVIVCTPNVGKDIGGKLAMFDTYLKLKCTSDLLVFLHDKVSPHSPMGEEWRDKLFKIIDPNVIPAILARFENPSVGMIGVEEHRITMDKDDELVYATNRKLLKSISQTYGIVQNAESAYIGGTMFWVRSSIYEKFFAIHSPLSVRSALEAGNVMDHDAATHTHSWERLLGWIVGSEGYNVQGI